MPSPHHTPRNTASSNKNLIKRWGPILAACHALLQLLRKPPSLECLSSLTPATWVKFKQAWISHSSHLHQKTPPCTQHSWENDSLQSKVLAKLGNFCPVVLAAGFYFMSINCGFFTGTGTGQAFFLSPRLFPSSELLTSSEKQNRVKTSKAQLIRI